MTRERMDFDVVIVGAGPAGLSTAIRLAQLAEAKSLALNIAMIEKGEEVGGHILSGAVLEPRALNELLPNWRTLNPPEHTAVTSDQFLWLTKKRTWRLPTPPQMQNHGNFIISLGAFTRWLASYAESLGINIFPGFAATEIIYQDHQVVGIMTGDKGVDRNSQPKANHQPGYELYGKQIVFAEGCRGSLTQTLFAHFNLREQADPQTYGLGIKELWEVPINDHQTGKVVHSIGWPLDWKTYGGGFVYHFSSNLISIGFVVGLDYQNPYLNPYEEFQRFKTHPAIAKHLAAGKRIAYGARTLIEGGFQSLPKLTFPGGVIVGDAAGFLNVPKIKGIHNAMKSGMVAAESIFPLLQTTNPSECQQYPARLKQSWLWDDLYRARNIRPAMNYGLIAGLAYAAIDTYLFRGKAPWTLHYKTSDHAALAKAKNYQPICYPKHDGKLTFDLTTSVYLANVTYPDENIPSHLKLKDPAVAIKINLQQFAGPEARYCPAGVYEFINLTQQPCLQINAGNCIHCKACDIKDPTQNIQWTPSEGGSGPQYGLM